jgi:UDP-N-acetyl-2-amino-2-deoxyglucuronate dehydrogenase
MESSTHGFRYAIVGCAAGIATTHLQALQQIPNAEIVAMADIAHERGAARAAEVGCPFFHDHQTLLASVVPDVIVVTTPHPFHAPIAIDAMAAGVHVLVEKPLAVSVSAGDAMIAAAEQHGKILAVSFQQRFRPIIEHAKQIIASGALGELVRVLMVEPWYRPAAYYRSAGWRGTWKGEGGGVLMNQGPHPLDLLCHLVGPPAKVWGWAHTRAHAIEVEDTAQAMLEYPNGAPGYLTLSTAEAGVERRLQIVGDKAVLELVNNDLRILWFSPSQSEFRASSQSMWDAPATNTEVIALPGDGGGHVAVYRDLEMAIQTGQRPRSDGREALMGLELANAITLSSHLGTPVSLPIVRAAYDTLLAGLQGVPEQRNK